MKFPDLSELQAAHNRIKPYIHNTPVLTSQNLNRISAATLFFKCENFQKMGAFKMRGAINALLKLPEEKRQKGVATHSSGNFAQALALSAKIVGIPAYIVMPHTAPPVKKDAVRGYGASIIECDPTLEAREKTLDKLVMETGATFLHPSNDMDVIVGNSTAVMELFEEIGPLDYVITPVGGGGLLAGTALAVKYLCTGCATIAGEPFAADDAYWSMVKGEIQPADNPQTIADGLRTALGDKNFPIIRRYVLEIIRVEEEEIVQAMRLVWERMKIIIEPSSAVAVAALFRENEKFAGSRTGIILSGGNVDLNKLPF